jgi:hypothetical protein
MTACLRLAACLLLLATAHAALSADACSASSTEQRATVVELYTSEGCNSCPPADQWLSTLHDGPRLVALAFHVDYWDRLGWIDRFSSPAYTERQSQQSRGSGARFVYTPQVLANGLDWRGWTASSSMPPSPFGSAPVLLQLQRSGQEVVAQVTPRDGAALPAQLAGYWALVEDGHASYVKAGENAGVTLHHDHVVRRYQPLAAWRAKQPQQLRFDAGAAAGDGHARRIVLVVTDAANGKPLQALALGC